MASPHIQRIAVESDELSGRIRKLREFRDNSPVYHDLSDKQRSLLAAQLQAMSCYSTILGMRKDLETKLEEQHNG